MLDHLTPPERRAKSWWLSNKEEFYCWILGRLAARRLGMDVNPNPVADIEEIFRFKDRQIKGSIDRMHNAMLAFIKQVERTMEEANAAAKHDRGNASSDPATSK